MKSLEELFKTKRMAFGPLDDNNTVVGLYDLIQFVLLDHQRLNADRFVATEFKPIPLIVEVGSYAGVSSDLFARYCKELVCVDIWNFKDGQGMGADIVEQAYNDFMEVTKAHGNIDVFIQHSVEAAKEFDNDSIDLVYIDAKHDYIEVQQDIRAWFPKVKPGGYLSGHDIHMDGVRQAVEEAFGTNYITYKDTSWITQK